MNKTFIALVMIATLLFIGFVLGYQAGAGHLPFGPTEHGAHGSRCGDGFC